LELEFTVKIPHGMEEADLARPVIIVRDFYTKRPLYEIYTYGEQVVVMPIRGEERNPLKSLAERQLKYIIEKYVDSDVRVEINGGVANVYVDESSIPHLIGKGGKTISAVEREAGIKINVQPLIREAEIIPNIVKRKKEIVLKIGKAYAKKDAKVFVNGEIIFSGTVSSQGEIKIKRSSPAAKRIMEAIAEGENLAVRIK